LKVYRQIRPVLDKKASAFLVHIRTLALNEDYSDVFLSHAQFYVFVDRYDIQVCIKDSGFAYLLDKEFWDLMIDDGGALLGDFMEMVLKRIK
jgi:hypothetical protein